MNDLYLLALANAAICFGIVFISICRLNAMEGDVLMRVTSEYTAYLCAALAAAFQPWWGEWPQWGSILVSGALLFGLGCSGHAWRRGKQDMAPDVAHSDHTPLSEESERP